MAPRVRALIAAHAGPAHVTISTQPGRRDQV
jgi:hypothetical protein